MADIGASVLARLKNKATESGRSYQLCLQLYCIVKALWTSFFLLIALGVAAFLVIFLMVWAVVKIEALGNFPRDWIWS